MIPTPPQIYIIEQTKEIFENHTAAQYVIKYNLKELEDIWYGRDARYRRDGTPLDTEN